MLRYNHAFVSMKYASETLTNEYSRFENVQQSIETLKMAEDVFQAISKLPSEKVQPYRYLSRTQCSKLASQCADLLCQSDGFLSRAEVT